MPPHKSDRKLLGRTGLYLMGNFPYIFKCKFGITDHLKHRRRSVSETTDGAVFTIAFARLLNGHGREGVVHGLYFWANAPFRKGSGRTEWFLNINPIIGAFSVWLFGFTNWLWYIPFFWSPIIWLDALLWMFIFWLGDVFLVALLFAAFVYGLTCL